MRAFIIVFGESVTNVFQYIKNSSNIHRFELFMIKFRMFAYEVMSV